MGHQFVQLITEQTARIGNQLCDGGRCAFPVSSCLAWHGFHSGKCRDSSGERSHFGRGDAVASSRSPLFQQEIVAPLSVRFTHRPSASYFECLSTIPSSFPDPFARCLVVTDPATQMSNYDLVFLAASSDLVRQ